MRRTLVMTLVLGAAALATAPAWAGGTKTIDVVDDDFVPQNEGNVVTAGGFSFDWGAGTAEAHNIRQDKKLFSSGPAVDNGSFALDQPSAGTFPYHCSIHGNPGSGMHGTLKVEPLATFSMKRRGDPEFLLTWAESTQTGDQFDVKYRVGDGKWKAWKTNTAKEQGVFGRNDKPVSYNPSKTYRFKVRSEKKGKPDRRSGFSPAAVVAPDVW